MKKKTSKQERAYMGLVAELGCIICGGIPEIHHNTKNRGYGAKSSNYDIIPLCVRHHRGEEGIHHIGVKTWQEKYKDQDDLVKVVKRSIYEYIDYNDYREYEAKRIGKSIEEIENYLLNNPAEEK
jgi:hypothetical protein